MRDADAPIDLVKHAAFVRRIAWAVLRNDADADDAAQEALRRTIQKPPGRARGVRGWLTVVVRNIVRKKRRGEERRERREGAVARAEGTTSAAGTAAHAEIVRRVSEALLALDEPSREVLVLRHYEGLPPREVAARLALPVETVKQRLKRAHEKMRGLLDEGRGGNVEGWRGALGAFVGFDAMSRVAEAAATASSAAAAGGTGAAAGTGTAAAGAAAGAIAMGTTAKVALCVVLATAVLGTAWIVIPSGSAAGRAVEPVPEQPAAVAPSPAGTVPEGEPGLLPAPRPAGIASRDGRAGDPAVPPPPERPAGMAPADAALGSEPTTEQVVKANAVKFPVDVVGGVVLGGAPSPLWRASLWAEPKDGDAPTDPRWHVDQAVGEDGRFVFKDVAAGRYSVRLFGPDGYFRTWTLGAPQTKEGNFQQVAVVGTASLSGHAYDREGAPATGRTVGLRPGEWAAAGSLGVVGAQVERDGAYRLVGLRSGRYHAFVYLDDGPMATGDARTDSVALLPGEAKTLDFGSPAAEPTWSGAARLSSGTALVPPATLVLEEVTRGSPVVHVPVGADGRFSKRVPRGSYRLNVWYRNHQGQPLVWPMRPVKLEIGDADLAQDYVAPGARVSGTVRDPATGRPYTVPSLERAIFVRVFAADAADPAEKALKVPVETDGTFVVDGVPAGRWRFVASGAKGEAGEAGVVVSVGDGDVGGVGLELRAP